MPDALARRRGACLNWRLAVNGIQYASSEGGAAAPVSRAASVVGSRSLYMATPAVLRLARLMQRAHGSECASGPAVAGPLAGSTTSSSRFHDQNSTYRIVKEDHDASRHPFSLRKMQSLDVKQSSHVVDAPRIFNRRMCATFETAG